MNSPLMTSITDDNFQSCESLSGSSTSEPPDDHHHLQSSLYNPSLFSPLDPLSPDNLLFYVPSYPSPSFVDPLQPSSETPTFWSGFNTAIPNLAKNFTDYISNYPNQFTNSISTRSPDMKYKQERPGMQIRVLGVPQSGAKSRVETQIKLCIQLVTDEGDKAQWWSHLKLPEHMVAKDKLKRQLTQNGKIAIDPIKNEKMLYLSARVICASDPTRKVVTCLGCIQRERKRSQRRKENKMKLEGEEEEEKSVSLEEQKVLLFNCSEIVDFSSGDTILPTRITCYCRHHNERLGFCIYFEMQDHTGKQVATGMSPPIMITDDHKSNKIKTTRKRLRTEDKSSFDMRKAGSPSNRINYHPHPYQIQPQPDNIRSPLDSPVFTEKPVDRPLLQRLIPNEGPTYGGIEVTLLGSGFRSGLTCMFGDVAASSTHYWSPNTLVCILPPATEAGTVVVSFKEHPLMVDNQEVTLFTYYNENDRALMELALQVVGLKMTGKVEDARDIAMRIVQGGNGQESKQLSNNNNNGNTNQLSLEQHIIQVLNIMSTFHDVESTDVSIKNPQGHTMLHLAAMLGFDELMERLIRLGCQVNRTDRNGYTALHYAVSYRHEKVIQVLLNGHADLDIVNRWNQKPFDTDLWETSTESSIEDAIQYLNEEENTSHSADEILDAELVEEKTWMQRTLSHFQPPPTDLKQLSDQFPFFSSNKVKEPTLAWYMALAYAMGAGLDKENPPPVEVKRKDRRLYSFWVPMLCLMVIWLIYQYVSSDPSLSDTILSLTGFRRQYLTIH